jgi:hypothetical protein
MSCHTPASDPLSDEIRRLVPQTKGRECGAYARLIKLGLKHRRTVSVEDFCEQLKQAEMPEPRISEIKAILAEQAVARKFVTTPMGIRQALKLARAASRAKAGANSKLRKRLPAAALTQIVRAADQLLGLMKAEGTYSVDCGAFRLRFQPPSATAGQSVGGVTPS